MHINYHIATGQKTFCHLLVEITAKQKGKYCYLSEKLESDRTLLIQTVCSVCLHHWCSLPYFWLVLFLYMSNAVKMS